MVNRVDQNPVETSDSTPRSRPLILIIEDDPDIGHLISRMLSPVQYDFLTTSTGKDGLRHANLSQPDVITLDLALPDMNGTDVLHRLKAADATRDIPVIVVSIHGDDSHQIAGAFAVMSKPVDRRVLRQSVADAVVSGRRGQE